MRPSLNYIRPEAVCAEIGVWKGEFSRLILKKSPKRLHLIDPWVSQYAGSNKWYSCPQPTLDSKFEAVSSLFDEDPRVEIHRQFSADAKFKKKYFDWVYIDGDHNYEVVKSDLYKYYELIKQGGFLCGHDYGPTGVDTNGGPKRAVDEFIKEKGERLLVKGDCRDFVIKVSV
tara:strand:- start:697 stop:1212 length:516 start_codon:yes stop_codon:yes gene_type:complete